MILFVVEGAKVEPNIYKTIKELYFREEEDIIYVFGSNIYALYCRLKNYDADFESIENASDIVAVLRELYPDQLSSIEHSSDIDQIFLFFDYDFQHAFHVLELHPDYRLEKVLEENNERLAQLLSFFNEETETGKLFINYPMVEALKYTKLLPDNNYCYYTTTLDECHGSFKAKAEQFSDYKAYQGILLDGTMDAQIVKSNWELLKQQNIMKAAYICGHSYAVPQDKDSISQAKIFRHQLQWHDNDKREIAILSSFPLFLYEYFK